MEDPVKVLDRGAISEFFTAGGGGEGGDDVKQPTSGDDAMDVDEDNKKDKAGSSGGVQFRQVEVAGEDKHKSSKRSSSSSSDKKRSRSNSQDKKRSSSGHKQHDESAKKKKKVAAATPMTNAQLLDNLSTIVGKRGQTVGKEEEKKAQLMTTITKATKLQMLAQLQPQILTKLHLQPHHSYPTPNNKIMISKKKY